MNRLTNRDNKSECKIHCLADEWMYMLYDKYPSHIICETCPFKQYIDRLAKLENEQERMENDWK